MSGDPETVSATTETEQMPAIETPAVEATTSEPVSAEGSATPETAAEAPGASEEKPQE